MFVIFIMLSIIIFYLCFLFIRNMIGMRINKQMSAMAIKDIPNNRGKWYLKWDVFEWVINPLRYNLWTAKSTKKYLTGV